MLPSCDLLPRTKHHFLFNFPDKTAGELRSVTPLFNVTYRISPAPRSLIVLFCPCSIHGALPQSRDAFQIPHSPSYQPVPCCQIGFHTILGPLPATRAMQLSPVSFVVGMHTGLLWLRIEWWESFRWREQR